MLNPCKLFLLVPEDPIDENPDDQSNHDSPEEVDNGVLFEKEDGHADG